MKITIKILVLLSVLFIQACTNHDCGECFTPPDFFVFQIVDKTTGENLFSNGTYDPADFKIVNLADDSNVEYTFIDENNLNIIQVNTIGWQTEKINYSFEAGTENLFNLYVDASRVSEDCCSFTRINEFRIDNAEFEHISGTGTYKILVD